MVAQESSSGSVKPLRDREKNHGKMVQQSNRFKQYQIEPRTHIMPLFMTSCSVRSLENHAPRWRKVATIALVDFPLVQVTTDN